MSDVTCDQDGDELVDGEVTCPICGNPNVKLDHSSGQWYCDDCSWNAEDLDSDALKSELDSDSES